MTVRQLINKLLDCKMDATVLVLVKIDKKALIKTLAEYDDFAYPIDDDIEIDDVDDRFNEVRILLEEFNG